jgi:ABC-type transporter Mla MlaB component
MNQDQGTYATFAGPVTGAGLPRLNLANALEMKNLRKLKADLSTALTQGQDLELDASGVERVSSGGMQLIIAFNRAMLERGLQVRIAKPSAVFLSAAELLGVKPLLSYSAGEA